MSVNFSQEEISGLKESFNAFDSDGNGSISTSELRSLLRIVGEKYSAQSIKDHMEEFDVNRDQSIDFSEFLQLAAKCIKNKSV
ncbi:hypothetical protein BG011_009076 [Mortierella polycephala]|uniref:EF-hand domain-containing protein n=1 Tax=Mortierella polycephala TaxID=41804 RepID=A0A9P6Q976_9FUNG|nr:hypothetical protein BG011_009076 [Mortierella polycephala]